MKSETVKWTKLMYPMLVHAAGKVRERALVAMDRGMPLILNNKDYQETISGDLVQDLKVVCTRQISRLRGVQKFHRVKYKLRHNKYSVATFQRSLDTRRLDVCIFAQRSIGLNC